MNARVVGSSLALVAVLLALAAVGWSGGDRPHVARPARAAVPQPLLAAGDKVLARLDPQTLRPLGRRLPLPDNVFAWTLSPDRRRLVLGANSSGQLMFVDVPRLRLLATMNLPTPSTLAWTGRRVLVVSLTGAYVTVYAVDPRTRRVLGARTLEERLIASARTPDGLALLLGPADGVWSASLVLIDSRLRVRRVELDRIAAGWELPEDAGESSGPIRHASPGLAVDPAGRAFVVGAGTPVAQVDLGTAAVTYHELTEPVSLLGRVHDWLEPRAPAKGPLDGSRRSAAWLGNSTLAVSGSDDHAWRDATGKWRGRSDPAGVRLVDTRAWLVRTLDREGGWLDVSGDRLLVGGVTWTYGASSRSGIGLRGYATDGSLRYQLLGGAPLDWLQVAGDRAVANLGDRYAVVDLAAGRVMRTARGYPPYLLVDRVVQAG